MRYKVFISILAVQAAVTFYSNAQADVGVHAGVAVSDFDAPSFDFARYTGPTIGVHCEHALMPSLSYRMELNYVQKGLKYVAKGPFKVFSEEPIKFSNVEYDIVGHYFMLPIYLKWKVLPGFVRPYIQAGPSIGYMSGEDINARFNGQFVTSAQSARLKKFDITADAGVGVELGLPLLNLYGGATYSHGLLNLSKSGGTIKSRTLAIVAGVTMEM